MTDVELTTGAKQSFAVDGQVAGAYSKPTGRAVVVSSSGFGDAPAMLKRVDMTGAEQVTYPTES